MKIKIDFETQTGTTQYVAETIQKKLQELGHEVDIHSVRFNGANPEVEKYQAVLFGAPTYDDGLLERGMRVFITRYNPNLSQLKVAVFGLGSKMYPQFCKAADFLEEWVGKNQGKSIVPALRVDGFPDDLTPIEAWVQQVHAALGTAAPVAAATPAVTPPAAAPTPASTPPAAPAPVPTTPIATDSAPMPPPAQLI